MKIYYLNAEAQAIFEQIISGINCDLSADETPENIATKHIGEKYGVYMRLSVECLYFGDDYKTFSFAHYYEQSGDLMRDPEIVFHVNRIGHIFPMQYTQDNVGMYQEFFHIEYESLVQLDDERKQKACKDFCNQWMLNICEQHPEYFQQTKAA